MELFISFSEIKQFFRRNLLKLVLLMLAVGIGFAAFTAIRFKPAYSATSTVVISCNIVNDESAASLQNSRIQTAIAMASSKEMQDMASKMLGIEQNVGAYVVDAEKVGESQLVKIVVHGPDNQVVADMANKIAELLPTQLKMTLPSPELTVMSYDVAKAPSTQSPVSSAIKSGLLGLVTGFVVFLCVALLVVLLDKSIRNIHFVSESLKMKFLGSIPRRDGSDDHMDSYRMIRSAVVSETGTSGVIVLTAPHTGAGCSEAAVGLGAALALADNRVLVVDANTNCPSVGQLIGSDNPHTLLDTVDQTVDLEQVLSSTKIAGLSVARLTGQEAGNNADFLASERFHSCMEELKKRFDYILFDTPAILQSPDATAAAGVSSGVILIAKHSRTNYEAFRESRDRMTAAGGNILGFICTNV